MAKGVMKKKNRKLRRQIRKTVGALLMVSAIVIAAVPVPDISANPADNTDSSKIKVAVVDDKIKDSNYFFDNATSPKKSTIPHAAGRSAAEQIVYTSGDGAYQFVYIDEVAVILQFNGRYLADNNVVIPDTIEAYRKYRDNSTYDDFCLVTKGGQFLTYVTKVQETQSTTSNGIQNVYYVQDVKDQSGNAIRVTEDQLSTDPADGVLKYKQEEKVLEPGEDGSMQEVTKDVYYVATPVMKDQYNPCYYADKSVQDEGDGWTGWGIYSDNQLFLEDRTTDPYTYTPAGTGSQNQRIDAQVAYIGAETVTGSNTTGWTLGGNIINPADGVFAGESNIVSITMSENIKGISDYAFYNCRNLESVTLNNGLEIIGNGAFSGCINLKQCNIDVTAKVTAIGKDAFYDCRALESFRVPRALEALGDNCFEGCLSLQNVDFTGGGGNLALEELGYHLFKNCSALPAVEFPSSYQEDDIDIDMFEGCSSLQKVVIPNSAINIGKFHDGTGNYPSCTMTWKDFLEKNVPSSFYFEGPNASNIHTSATENSAAFKYLGQDLYEKVMYEDDINGKDKAKLIYQINSTGDLVKFLIEEGSPANVTIPETIGAYGIKNIGAGSFNDNCDLTRITIPASVTSIGTNAFRGCHNLKTVIFTDAAQITSIGNDAFKTQDATCGEALYPSTGVNKPKLYFVGTMMNAAGQDTETFKYAMNGQSNINNSNQEKIWITCHSGWPTNLEVEYYYVPETNSGYSQLVGYPRYEMLKDHAADWVDSLPYATLADEKADYLKRVQNATAYWEGASAVQPTENEMAIVRSALNVAIPSSVNSIKPGLFSGWTYDEDGNPKAVYEIDNTGKPTTKQIESDKYLETILINGVDTIEPYTFKDCEKLRSADIIGSRMLDDYAFDDCKALEAVTLGTNMQDTGKRPFKGCGKLMTVNCLDPSNFAYNSGILYRNTGNGKEIVECLENRGVTPGGTGSYNVGPDELAGISSIKPEAFADCKDIAQVDLSVTSVDIIPEGCFQNTQINSITLPKSLQRINENAFKNGGARRLVVYFKSNPTTIVPNAFDNEDKTKQQQVIFQCLENSNPDYYAKDYEYITTSDDEVFQEFEVEFWNLPDYPAMTNMALVERQVVRAGEDAVPPAENPTCNDPNLQFTGWSEYRNIQKDTSVYAIYGSPEFRVVFIDGYTGEIIKEEMVKYGQSATPPTEEEIPNHSDEGQMFTGWNKEWYNIKADTEIRANYVDSSGDANRHRVTFYDDNGKELYYQYVNDGDTAITPMPPTKDGYKFVRWMWVPEESATAVKEDTSVFAQFERDDNANPSASPSGGDLTPGGSPSPGGNTGTNGSPSPSSGNNNNNNNSNRTSSPTATPTATPTNGNDVVKYTVSVSGGSGSGSYPAGAVVAINAYFMGEGQVFDKWTSSTAGVGFANPNASSTTFTMPAANVSVTATYKTGGAGTATTNASGGSSGNRVTGTATTSNGSTVDITRPGISNTNLAGATVSGATDNFVVKVTEDQAATDAATTALQARFGDLSRIKYFPMDISLYDSTGRTKIADTSGISVNLTLPLPDELIQYAGNNKIAAIAGGALEDLNARFTTVDGVPCINFTATHFSPYVIYVDTANLTEATIDATPKTGDPIHPKWFLALGMACMSLILFFKRDKAVIKTKIA